MVGFRPGIARCHRLPGRVSGLTMAIGLLVAACGASSYGQRCWPHSRSDGGRQFDSQPIRWLDGGVQLRDHLLYPAAAPGGLRRQAAP
jgi:hypothetical protein